MLKMHDLTQGIHHGWDKVSEGWGHLIGRAGQALTHFHSDTSKGDKADILAGSSRWGLISADMFDDADKVVVQLEAPGLSAEDFDINVIENVLIVSGEKHFQREESEGDYRLLERAYGRFSRSIPLGYEVDADTARASYKKGVLKIELEKQPHQKRRHIKIQ